jgi:hypothetical protein
MPLKERILCLTIERILPHVKGPRLVAMGQEAGRDENLFIVIEYLLLNSLESQRYLREKEKDLYTIENQGHFGHHAKTLVTRFLR